MNPFSANIERARLPVAIKADTVYLAGINQGSLSAPESGIEQQEQEQEQEQSEGITWRIEKIKLDDLSVQLGVNDHSVPLNLDELTVGAIDSRQLRQSTPLNLELMAHNAKLDVEISVSHLDTDPNGTYLSEIWPYWIAALSLAMTANTSSSRGGTTKQSGVLRVSGLK